MPTLMLNVVEVDDVKEVECCKLECELHALTWTTTHKGGWFGLIVGLGSWGVTDLKVLL